MFATFTSLISSARLRSDTEPSRPIRSEAKINAFRSAESAARTRSQNGARRIGSQYGVANAQWHRDSLHSRSLLDYRDGVVAKQHLDGCAAKFIVGERERGELRFKPRRHSVVVE